MKSNLRQLLSALLPALGLLGTPGQAQDKAACEVAVAALTLPDDSSGLLNVRTAETATSPLQLSTRYFSERVKLPGLVIQFFKDPVAATPATPAAVPLLTLQIPAETKLAYAVLWSETDKNHQPVWKGRVFNARDWDQSSLKVFNATSEPVGIQAGAKQILLVQGKSTDFPSRDWGEPFPAKIFQLQPERKCIFSSTWRVAAGNRELCFIFKANNAVTLRSLLDIAPTQRTPAP
jgi:hypothetical protein